MAARRPLYTQQRRNRCVALNDAQGQFQKSEQQV